MRRVLVDTSVLFPFSVMDLFLALTENTVHQVLWTDELLEEWERVIVREHQRSAASAASVAQAIREFFPDCRIPLETYRDRIASMPGPDPDDHPHSAAAIAAGVNALVTADVSGFPRDELAGLGVRVVDPDTYLMELFDAEPVEVTATVVAIARGRTRPPLTPADLVAAFRGAGLQRFPDAVEARL